MTSTVVLTVACVALAAGPSASPPPGPSPAMPGSILFGTVFDSLATPSALARDGIPADVRACLPGFAARAAAFRSRLPEPTGAPGPGTWQLEKRRHLERDLVALIPGEGVAETAAAYAREAVIAYEWEGASDGPLGEAAFAEAHLRDRPATMLRPYLQLFLAHRYRCAEEASRRAGELPASAAAAERYRFWLAAARADADPLVRFVADDLGRRSHLYLAAGPDTLETAGPSLSMRQALDQADRFLADRGVDLAGQYLNSAALRYDETARSPYWQLQWAWRRPRLGMEYGLRVYLDGRVVEARLGP
jgi:hypothetical protein